MFDLKVQHRDTRTGRVVRQDPYRLHVVSGKQYYERPVGSGNLWYRGGEAAGQIMWENDGKKKVIKEGMEHIQYQRPLSINEEMQREFDARGNKVADLEAKIAEMEAAAIKAEADEKVMEAEAEAKPAVKAAPKKVEAKAAPKGK